MVRFFIIVISITALTACNGSTPDQKRTPLLEVEGKFLYLDQVEDIIPPNVNEADSTQIADAYIRKWVTDVLMYENAKRNVSDKAVIDRLLDEYRKSLTIHQYQQRLIQQRLPQGLSETQMKTFYEDFSDQFILKEPLIKGLLLVIPVGAPKMTDVRKWVRSGNTESLEQIEKYSIQHALSYDYFADRWVPVSEISKKLPSGFQNAHEITGSSNYYELSDSIRHFMLSINEIKKVGEVEPFEVAKDKITAIVLNKMKSDFISNFENELYKDAVKDGTITFFRP